MHWSSHNVSGAILGLLSVSIITTVTFIGLSMKSRIVVNYLVGTTNDENKSSNIDEHFRDLNSSVAVVMSKVQADIENDQLNITEISRSLDIALKQMKRIKSQIENVIATIEIKSFLFQPIINDHNFSYIHNPVDTCSKNNSNLLIVLPSAPTNFEKREKVRNGSRGDYVRNSTNNAKMVFFLGRPSPKSKYTKIQEQIDEEANLFGDIVQENFEDVYSNLQLKSVSMLKWASTYCPTTKFIIRTDDDINVNVTLLVSVLHRTAQTLNTFIIGRKRVNDKPERNAKRKYYMSLKEYPFPTYPPFLLGGLVGYTNRTARLLYQAALRVKPVWLEDVYITGLCAPKVHVTLLTDPLFKFFHKS